MKENQRKCLKCGCSPAEDPTLKLFRFPQPGIRNTLRCELWAKFCFPERGQEQVCSPEFQKKLYSEHRMLCEKHFKQSSFIDLATKQLHRFAVPDDEPLKKVFVPVPNLIVPKAGTSKCPLMNISNKEPNELEAGPSKSTLIDISNEGLNKPQVGSSLEKEQQASQFTTTYSTERAVKKFKPGPSHEKSVQPTLDNIITLDSTEKNVIKMESNPSQKNKKDRHLYLKCRKYMKKVCQMRNRIKKLKNDLILKSLQNDESVKSLMKKITPSFALLLQGELKNCKRKSKGRRWSKEEKIIALRLYKRSPTCYRLLRRMFCLPAPGTLKQTLGLFPLQVGINKKVFNMLKKFTATQDEIDNEYLLAFDEMSIRKHVQYNKKEDIIEGYQDHGNQGRSMQVASHALVFMVCGIRKKIKQPVAYYLSGSSVTADRLQVLIKEVLQHCFDAGINISATVCDMDGVNRRALNLLGATSQNPGIEIFGHDVVTMYDPPHLLKCFRNLFMKYDVKHLTNITSGDNKGLAKWSHIQEFYRLDNLNPNFVFTPSLKEEHLAPNNKQKMKVKLAAQVLSHSVAAGMFAKISQGELPLEATVTANLVSRMDKLFDCLNSDSPDLRRGKPHATNLTKKTPHINLFQEMKKVFETIEFVGCKSKPPSVEGWVWTLNAVEQIWYNLMKRHPTIRSLSTRRLQQDPLENLFGCVRGHCGSNSNPTAGQFVAGLKTAILSNLAQLGSGNNCEQDTNDAIINNFKELLDSTPTSQPNQQQKVIEASIIDKRLEEKIEKSFQESSCEGSGEIQACAYVCGFILKNNLKTCDVCQSIFTSNKIELEHNFVTMKEYEDFKKSLKYASRELITCVEYCATTIKIYLEREAHKKNLRQTITELLKNSEGTFDFLNKCSAHKQENIQNLTNNVFYICIKRLCTLKNRAFIGEASAIALNKKISILKHT